MLPLLALLVAVQDVAPGAPVRPPTTPDAAAADTSGYWQQSVHYEIVARLVESRGAVAATGRLRYTNRSPDTLDELVVHQHLNAFRPASKWSETDEREGRVRFQHLREPDFAYERFTGPVRIVYPARPADTLRLAPVYPGAPDSTVVRFALPRPLAPGDSVIVHFEWEARPSTLPRRQARRGRSFDFAQWYPRVAVHDRLGWRPNPLVPAGEFYGEFGSYDVTLVLPEDQVVGATGVPVAGDPGWERVRRGGVLRLARDAYGPAPAAPAVDIPAGFRAIRFLAHGVHHFAWSVSPDYRYEGGTYVRGAGAPTWDTVRQGAGAPTTSPDTVSVHVLYRPGDEATWGNGVALEREIEALRWLEHVFGPYAYPQVTNLHRIEGGGTEFPMVTMNGSASQGLMVHETAHIYAHGLLANNEWESGWLDEGLASYVTSWHAGETLPERAAAGAPAGGRGTGYRALATTPRGTPAAQVSQIRLDLLGRAEPIGTRADLFNEFSIYGAMIYGRAERMYGALRDAIGDSAFRRFLRDYYATWAFRHVDEAAMRGAAERASGMELDWFFDQWVHRTGLVDYALRDVDVERDGSAWRTRARVVRRGEYLHPVPLGVRTADGWTFARIAPASADTTLVVRTTGRPEEVRLDPLHVTEDWDARNDVAPPRLLDVLLLRAGRYGTPPERVVFDWPFLDQFARHETVTAVLPFAWYSERGEVTYALRTRSNYLGFVDRAESGLAYASEGPSGSRLQYWVVVENPREGARVGIGSRVGAWKLDDVAKVELRHTTDESGHLAAGDQRRTSAVALTATLPTARAFLPRAFTGGRSLGSFAPEIVSVFDLALSSEVRGTAPDAFAVRAMMLGGAMAGPDAPDGWNAVFGRAELEGVRETFDAGRPFATLQRLWFGASYQAPYRRAIGLSSRDATETFENHFWRPNDGVLSDDAAHFTPLGGMGLRGYAPGVALGDAAAVSATLEWGARLARTGAGARALGLWATLFADGAGAVSLQDGGGAFGLGDTELFADAGVGLAVRGMLFDRPVVARLDVPLLVEHPELATGAEFGDERLRGRWVISLGGF
ncbi:MAG TPA: M1 family metallopeptidase [Gemmatimonadaceae bacterium]